MIKRLMASVLTEAREKQRLVLLLGPRQAGKTTLALSQPDQLPKSSIRSLDDLLLLTEIKRDSAPFLKSLAGPVILDDFHRATELLVALDRHLESGQEHGPYLLVGATDLSLLPGPVGEVVQKAKVLTLWPLAQRELLGGSGSFIDDVFDPGFRLLPTRTRPALESRAAVIEAIVQGGYPEILSRSNVSLRRTWFGTYLANIMQRDVRDLNKVGELSVLIRLLIALAQDTGSLLNFAALSRAAGITQTTLKRYLRLLQAVFLVHLLPAWPGVGGKRLIRTPKVYLSDTGLASHLLGLNPKGFESEPRLLQALLENFVVMELTKQAGWSRTAPRLHHWRTASNQQVDLVLEDSRGQMCGIKVKASERVEEKDRRELRVLADSVGDRFHSGYVVYLGADVVPIGDRLFAIPVSLLAGPGLPPAVIKPARTEPMNSLPPATLDLSRED